MALECARGDKQNMVGALPEVIMRFMRSDEVIAMVRFGIGSSLTSTELTVECFVLNTARGTGRLHNSHRHLSEGRIND